VVIHYDVVVETGQAEFLAAVRETVPIGGIGQASKPALDQVLTVLRKNDTVGADTGFSSGLDVHSRAELIG
jgi:hypothetical protein